MGTKEDGSMQTPDIVQIPTFTKYLSALMENVYTPVYAKILTHNVKARRKERVSYSARYEATDKDNRKIVFEEHFGLFRPGGNESERARLTGLMRLHQIVENVGIAGFLLTGEGRSVISPYNWALIEHMAEQEGIVPFLQPE